MKNITICSILSKINIYLNVFGYPDHTEEIKLEDKVYSQMYWYKPDVIAEFVCPVEDIDNGWEFSFALSLDPLRYYLYIQKEKDNDSTLDIKYPNEVTPTKVYIKNAIKSYLNYGDHARYNLLYDFYK